MKVYKTVEVSEKQLEDLIRQGAGLIEEGLRHIDHQRFTDRGPLDVLMVDSGNALVIAELKIVEDDTMMVQGIDYYDYVVRNIEGIARTYKNFHVDPKQQARLFLIAPSFTVALLNRCKWIDIPISLFIYKCITFEDLREITPIYSEITLPAAPKVIEEYSMNDRLKYITNPATSTMLSDLLKEIGSWDSKNILIEPTKYDISLKISGRVFSYIGPRRKHFIVYTHDEEKKWSGFPIRQKEDLEPVLLLLKGNITRLARI